MAAHGAAIQPPPTLLDSVLSSVLTPGAGPGLVTSINAALLALVATLAGLVYTGDADVHTAVLAGLALCLMASVNVFVAMVGAAEEAGAVGGVGAGAAATAGGKRGGRVVDVVAATTADAPAATPSSGKGRGGGDARRRRAA